MGGREEELERAAYIDFASERAALRAAGTRAKRGIGARRSPEGRLAHAVIESAMRELLDYERKVKRRQRATKQQRGIWRKRQDDLVRWLATPGWAHTLAEMTPRQCVQRAMRRMNKIRRRV